MARPCCSRCAAWRRRETPPPRRCATPCVRRATPRSLPEWSATENSYWGRDASCPCGGSSPYGPSWVERPGPGRRNRRWRRCRPSRRRHGELRAQSGQDEDGIRAVVRGSKRVAVLGIKTEQQSGQPAFYVPEYLAHAGVEVVPVPVYFPEVTHILERP